MNRHISVRQIMSVVLYSGRGNPFGQLRVDARELDQLSPFLGEGLFRGRGRRRSKVEEPREWRPVANVIMPDGPCVGRSDCDGPNTIIARRNRIEMCLLLFAQTAIEIVEAPV